MLLSLTREFARVVLQAVVQSLEPEDPCMLPRDVIFQSGGYRRRGDRTRKSNIATRFGNIVLWRRGYRSWQRGEETVFPIERMLGLTENVSPALLDLLGRSLASAGMSQQATLAVIQEQCGVRMGVKRLRACLASLADAVEPLRQTSQVDRLLEMLTQAGGSSGSRKPVLMRWSHVGARRILTLRTILLSGVWESTYAAYLSKHQTPEIRPYERNQPTILQKAA